MGYWIEIHCDTPLDEVPAERWVDGELRRCANMSAGHPGMGFPGGVKGSWLTQGIAKAARRAGYVKKGYYGWQCPFCLKYRPPK